MGAGVDVDGVATVCAADADFAADLSVAFRGVARACFAADFPAGYRLRNLRANCRFRNRGDTCSARH